MAIVVMMGTHMDAGADRADMNAHHIGGRRNRRKRHHGQNACDQGGFKCVRHCSRLPEWFCALRGQERDVAGFRSFTNWREARNECGGREEAYGLNFLGIAAACSGVSGVMVLTMHGIGMS